MLEEISIKNLILIKSLTLPFHEGFTSITGETGAGKSILLASLGLICGQRASSELIRRGEEKSQISACFDLPKTHPARSLLEEHDIELAPSEPLIIRRTLSRSGRSQIWIADQGVSLSFLKKLTATLIEIQGQHTQLELADVGTHQHYLDDFGQLTPLRAQVARAFASWQDNLHALEQEKKAFENSQREEDYLQHSDEELTELDIKEGEEEELAKKRVELKNKEKEGEAAAQAYAILTAQSQPTPSALSLVTDVQRRLDSSTDVNSEDEVIRQIQDYIHTAQDALGEAEALLDQFLNTHRPSTATLDDVEGRLFKIREIARKYDVQPYEIPQIHADIQKKRRLLENAQENFQQLQNNVKETFDAYVNVARHLHEERVKAAKGMEEAIARELKPLGMGKAHFEISIEEKDPEHYTKSGLDTIRFLMATNPGQEATDLSKTISGGELSRIALALRVMSKTNQHAKTLVFDEIDTGLGGATAGAIGIRLRKLGKKDQVIAVTHNPQVAALTQTQLYLKKITDGQETITTATTLDEEQRIEEIARMLSANKITSEARAAARSLLQSNKT